MQTISANFIKLSRNLRKNQTPWEHTLWQRLRGNRFYGLQFKRQVRLADCIVDFYCSSKKLIIELDGSHHNQARYRKIDSAKEKYFKMQGFRVLRFWNREIDENLNNVMRKIREEVLFETTPGSTVVEPSSRQERPTPPGLRPPSPQKERLI